MRLCPAVEQFGHKQDMAPVSIAVVYSLPTERAKGRRFLAADEDTQASAQEVFEALRDKQYRPILFPVAESAIASLKALRADCIFNLIEWDGLDLALSAQAFDALNGLHIPITGASKENYLLTTDKIAQKKALDAHQLPTAPWQVFTTGGEPVRGDFQYPVIVKLALEHGSVGLDRTAVVLNPKDVSTVVRDRIATYKQPVLVEEFLPGREFQVTVLDRESGPVVLPVAENLYGAHDSQSFLTFESRWEQDHPDYALWSIDLAKLTGDMENKIRACTLRTFHDLGFRDYARLDIREREGEVSILEANPNPALSDSDGFGMTLSYRAAGMTFADFIDAIVRSCCRRAHSPP
jgi:D-alanine-D-alanine ligase